MHFEKKLPRSLQNFLFKRKKQENQDTKPSALRPPKNVKNVFKRFHFNSKPTVLYQKSFQRKKSIERKHIRTNRHKKDIRQVTEYRGNGFSRAPGCSEDNFCQFIQGSLGQTNFPIVARSAVTSEELQLQGRRGQKTTMAWLEILKQNRFLNI